MAIGFIMWSMASFDKQNFAICGRTIEALRRNVIVHIPTWLEGMFEVTERRSENKMVVTIGNRSNTYYLFGGRDESSYTLIQGITLAGVLFDEVALMPRSFVEQAMARCSVSGSKFWFNCNPESPGHWFYKEWIRKAAERNMLYLHFTMDDNLSLDEKIKARYEGMYSGVFYDRYIRGLWTVAEGLIYTMFNKDYHVVPSVPRDYEEYLISCDYGTLNPTSAGLWGLCEGKWYRVREYYYDGRKERYQRTDEEHYWVIDLVDKLKLCWQKAGVAIANFMGDMKVSVLTILQNMINGAIDIINKFIGVLNKIPGVSIDAIEHVTFATTAAAENEAAKSARAADLAAYESELASAKAGRDAHIDSLKAELNSSVDALQAAYAQAKADAAADSSAEQTALDGIGADTAGINDSAGSAAASLKETTEDLKYMRDLAEQEAINRFTTAEVKIDMTGMTNRIDSDMDLDGVLNTLTEGFAEALEVAAEGVHE